MDEIEHREQCGQCKKKINKKKTVQCVCTTIYEDKNIDVLGVSKKGHRCSKCAYAFGFGVDTKKIDKGDLNAIGCCDRCVDKALMVIEKLCEKYLADEFDDWYKNNDKYAGDVLRTLMKRNLLAVEKLKKDKEKFKGRLGEWHENRDDLIELLKPEENGLTKLDIQKWFLVEQLHWPIHPHVLIQMIKTDKVNLFLLEKSEEIFKIQEKHQKETNKEETTN